MNGHTSIADFLGDTSAPRREMHVDEYRLLVSDGKQRARQQSGEDTEGYVKTLNTHCETAGIAVLTKRPTQMRKIQGVMRHSEPAGVDFHGVLKNGRAVYLEVKRCTGDRFPLAHIRTSQKLEFEKVSRLGALCLVVIVHGSHLPTASVCPIEWAVFARAIEAQQRSLFERNATRRGRRTARAAPGLASLSREEILAHAVPVTRPYLERWTR